MKEADVQIYAIGIYESVGGRGRTPEEMSGPGLLTEIAEQTGGRAVFGGESERSAGCRRPRRRRGIAESVHPGLPSGERDTRDGKYRKVQVRLIQPKGMPILRPFWKLGYYAPAK